MTNYQLSDVFNEAQIPTVTFVPPREFLDIVGSLRTIGKHLTLCGPSGCGKTTLAKKALEKAQIFPGDQYWISGRDFSDLENLDDVLEKAFGCDRSEINEWMQACKIIVIDDFHHLCYSARIEIAKRLKRWHELHIRCFVIGIAESAHQLLESDQELGIRNDPYDMRVQDERFIEAIIRLGEKALNFSFSETTLQLFVQASKGIPSAIHVICRVACLRSDLFETCPENREISPTIDDIKDGVLRIYKGKFQNKIIGLSKGKQQAASVHNTYFQIIRHICLIDKSEIGVEEIRARIVGAGADDKEKARLNTSFYNCIKNLQAVIEERGLNDALYYDANSKTISIEDPSFRFYLTLADLDEIAKSVKVRKGRYPWDVAVSFAGDQRAMVEGFRDLLNQRGYTVFYDFDEQHKLWGQNLRLKLADVYANDAEYMIVFLSKEYPEKDWPAFEIEIGKEAKKKRTQEYLLPLIVDDVNIVGLPKDVGYLDLRTTSIEQAVETLIKKIEEGQA